MEIKQRILQQATDMFFKNGVRSITMDEIADPLGISKRTLYEIFQNKEELIRECIEYKYQENKTLREKLLAENSDNLLEVIYQHFRLVLITLNTIHPSFFTDMKKYYSSLWREHIKNKQDENIQFTKTIIEKGIEQGVFYAKADPLILSTMAHSSMQSLGLDDIFPETRFAKAEVVRQAMMNFIRGMATQEGLKIIDEKFQ